MLTVTSSPLKGAGGMFITITSPRPANRHISPFEGSPRAGAAEYVQRGDVYNRQINSSTNWQIDSSPHHLIPHQLLNRNFLRNRVSRLHTITTDKVNARSFHQLIPR